MASKSTSTFRPGTRPITGSRILAFLNVSVQAYIIVVGHVHRFGVHNHALYVYEYYKVCPHVDECGAAAVQVRLKLAVSKWFALARLSIRDKALYLTYTPV